MDSKGIPYVLSLLVKTLFVFIIIWNLATYLLLAHENDRYHDEVKVDASTTTDLNSVDVYDTLVDRKYCGSDKCKFLFAYRVREQESQANVHFYSAIQLAEMLDRTVVLVNLQNSRIGACLKLPFDFYYDIERLKKLFPKVNFISQQDFVSWTKERRIKPSAVVRKIEQGGIPNTFSQEELDLNVTILSQDRCLKKFDFNFDDAYERIRIGSPDYWRKVSNNRIMTSFLVSRLGELDEQVLLLEPNKVTSPLFPYKGPVQPLPYATHIIEAANNVTKHLRPYIGIHWRQETVRSRRLPRCAKGLVKYIQKLKSKTGIENIYYATDYPIYNGGKKAQSSTFHVLNQDHHDSMKIVNSTLTLNTWISLKALDILYEKFPRFKKHIDAEFGGSGIQGILDKLVLIHSDYFVSGPPGCCRTSSNFTKRIKLARILLKKSGDKNIHDIISHWTVDTHH